MAAADCRAAYPLVALKRVFGQLHGDDGCRTAGGGLGDSHAKIASRRSIPSQLDDLGRGHGLAIQLQ